jgi:hypothetical protein
MVKLAVEIEARKVAPRLETHLESRDVVIINEPLDRPDRPFEQHRPPVFQARELENRFVRPPAIGARIPVFSMWTL